MRLLGNSRLRSFLTIEYILGSRVIQDPTVRRVRWAPREKVARWVPEACLVLQVRQEDEAGLASEVKR